MKALVTGASGFIGGAVAQALLRRGDHVRVLLRPGSSPNLQRGKPLLVHDGGKSSRRLGRPSYTVVHVPVRVHKVLSKREG